MDNYAIADQFSLLAKLMDIHGENSFKTKSYSSAAFTIEKLLVQLSTLPQEKIIAIKGIGESTGKKVMELLQTGELKVLKDLIGQTPAGVLEMMNIKGLGPKKIHTLWKEMGINTIAELEQACTENRIADKKGFGIKSQQKIVDSIQFIRDSEGKFLYAQLDAFAISFTQKLKESFPDHRIEITGAFRRQMEVIDRLEWVADIDFKALQQYLQRTSLDVTEVAGDQLCATTEEGFMLCFHSATEKNFGSMLFKTSCSPEYLAAWQKEATHDEYTTEEAIFEKSGMPYLPPFLRESASEVHNTFDVNKLVQTGNIKGLIHAHSNWSDGAYTIAQMAEELIKQGFEYLVLSDHSKAAYYANGLDEAQIKKQHKEIDALNKKLAPFKIYKSIECDILSDGQMDYSDEVLASFDLVIASIHSNLDMEEDKAMQRLLGAINNPHVRMMGHLTGRRLLRRPAYPINHHNIIDACAANGVAIEINASPERLDIDWRYIQYALHKGVLLSINPDAHSLDDFANIKYGVLAAQKGGLTPAHNISSFSRDAFEAWLMRR